VRKTIAVLGSALFFAVAPSSVAGASFPWWIYAIGSFGRPSSISTRRRAVGNPVDRRRSTRACRHRLHALRCKDGHAAPIAPTQNLVVTGLYRYVRNPI